MAGQDGFALGVAFGMSTTVAVLRGPDGQARPLHFGPPAMPSGVYPDGSGRLDVGHAASATLTDAAGHATGAERADASAGQNASAGAGTGTGQSAVVAQLE